MLEKSIGISALMIALVTGNVIWGGTAVHAEEPNQVFTLDPMVVTATRTEKRDVDVPASTTQVRRICRLLWGVCLDWFIKRLHLVVVLWGQWLMK